MSNPTQETSFHTNNTDTDILNMYVIKIPLYPFIQLILEQNHVDSASYSHYYETF